MTTVPSAGNNSSLMREKQHSSLDNHFRCQMETNTNIDETDSRVMQINDNNNVSNSSSIQPPSPLEISTPSTTMTTTTTTAHESLVNEEQRCNGVDEKEIESKEEEKEEKKKNNSSFTHDDVDNDDPHHASGIILVNDELGQTALSREEKKEDEDEREEEEGEETEEEERERASSPLPAIVREQSKPHRTEDESAISIVNSIPMDEDQIYKKVELEEIPDEEESQTFVDKTIEPTDFLLIDEEPKKTTTTVSTAPTVPPPAPMPPKFDPLVSCYEKVLAKLADGTDESLSTTSVQGQAAEQDPIALRALQRFEERMSAATTKKPTSKEEPNSFSAKGKSSWSGSMTTPRKSLENLFKSTEMSLSTSNSDGYIKPRKTFDDEPSSPLPLNIVQVLKDSSSEEQQTGTINEQPNENKREEKIDNEMNAVAVTSDVHLNEQQNESLDINNTEVKTVEQMQMSDEQSSMIPYRLQLEGRRRLNTLERMRERRQSRETLDDNEPTITTVVQSSEDIQDPIVRRALERFDEKNRTLQQMKPTNYDDIEDPITRRALMRLESNMKRANPPTSVPTPSSSDNHHNESWFTNNYTLGSLQPTSDRLSRYSDYAQSSNPNNNKTTYVSVHQRYCTPSTTTDLSTNSSQVAPMGYRQRSRSEDMLSSRDLMVGPTTDLDQLDNSPSTVSSMATGATGTPNALQRNRSSNQLATVSSTALQLPTAFIKTLEPAFVRTTESTVSYVTPTQTYSAYSCEYTRPRRNPQIGAATTETTFALKQEPSPTQTPTPTPRYLQNNNTNLSEIQRPTTTTTTTTAPNNRPPPIDNQYSSTSSTSSTSAFAPVRSSANTSSYYSSTPSYTTSHSTNASVATAPTDDPIIRRALERFNCQVQNSLMTTSAYSRPTQPNQYYDQNPRSNIMTTSGGYQSIIGRRRQTRYDEVPTYQKDQLSSVGDGYSSSVFANPPQSYYMNMSNEPPAPPPAIPPRYRRDDYFADPYRRYSNEDYLSENTNNNNNTHPYGQETFIHHAYPATITNATSFRPIHIHYNQQIDPSNIYSRDRPQSSSSTTSTDSIKQGIASSLANGGQMTEQPTIGVIGNAPSDSVFHRMAYTGTKATLSKSSSNLFNKSPQSMPVNQLKSCEIDFDEMIPVENSPNNNGEKYQRSKSVENRTRMKLSQTRPTINLDPEESSYSSNNDEQTRFVPSSKFTSISNRRDIPVRTMGSSNGNSVHKYSNRTTSRGSNGEMIDGGEIENDENCSYPDAVPMRTTIPVQRYSGHNSIQSSASTSSVSSVMSRNKPIVSIPVTLDRRDSNDQTINNNRFARRSDETTRVLSPPSPRRQVPVSVFSPATKIDNKRPAPAPPVSSQDESHSDDHFRPIATHVTTNGSKTPTGTSHSNDFTLIHDKTDSTTHSKKMNVFERLFRGNRKRNS